MSKTRGVAGRTPAILLPPETNRRHRPLPPITMPVRGAAYRVLTQEFIADLHEHWREHGKAALDALEHVAALLSKSLAHFVEQLLSVHRFVAQLDRLRADAKGAAGLQ
jgi:hypothetical protein